MKIFLDDIRQINDIYAYGSVKLPEWVITRNYDSFITEVKREFPSFVSFDHDLADEHYNHEAMRDAAVYDKVRQTFKEKTGLECAKWLVEYCMETSQPFPDYHVHSFNPVGAENIRSYIECFKKFQAEH